MALQACKEKPRPQRASPVVSVKTAAKGPLPYIVIANGEVEANRSVAVQSLVSGMLTSVAISEGDEVREGQVLFQIDSRPFRAELERVRGTLSRDEAQLVRLRSDSVRFAGLAKDGYVTKQQLDQTFADATAMSATVAADRAALQRAQLDLENTTIKAPISGRTGLLAIKAGNLVRAQSDPPLLTINELSPVLVRFSVPERDFAEMRSRAGLDKPLAVTVRPNVGDSTHYTTGKLAFINNVVDRATGSVLLKARVENKDRNLWPGQFVTVGLELSVDSNAVTVPAEAVVTTASGTYVYLFDDGKAVRVNVRVGRQMAGLVKLDSGLVGGEQVIVEGQNRLSEGAKVELRDGDAGIRWTWGTWRAWRTRGSRGRRIQAPVAERIAAIRHRAAARRGPHREERRHESECHLDQAADHDVARHDLHSRLRRHRLSRPAGERPADDRLSDDHGQCIASGRQSGGDGDVGGHAARTAVLDDLRHRQHHVVEFAGQCQRHAAVQPRARHRQGCGRTCSRPSPRRCASCRRASIRRRTTRRMRPTCRSRMYSFSTDQMTRTELNEYVETFVGQRLSTVSGVAQVQVFGSAKYAVRIQLDPGALVARGIGIDEVQQAVQAGNSNLPGGVLMGPNQSFTVQASGQLKNALQYRQLVVAYRNNAPVRLGDLGNVLDDLQNQRGLSELNGRGNISLAIIRQPGVNTVAVSNGVRDELELLKPQLPSSIRVEKIYDKADSIEESVNDVKFTMMLTLFLVVMVIFLFLRNVRATAIPSLALPFSLIGTCCVMWALNFSLDNLSLMALTLAVGFVVDDAIVMLENIVRHLEMGKKPMQAALDGSKEISFTILSMTISLVAVFIPLLFMPGLVGRLFREFAVTIGVAILVSGFISLTLTPMLCARFLHEGEGTRPVRREVAVGRAFVSGE